MSLVHLGAPAALIDLSGTGHFITWGWFSISYGNATVILLMVVAFVLALVLPFPGSKR